MNKIILHIDMNSYFASVEQQANPFLRGKPVGVCAYLSPGGCIIASSVEAKAKGIKTGMRVKDALNLDPKVVLLENEPAKYRSTTEKIFKILGDYSDRVEPYSIDEAFLDLTGQPSLLSESELRSTRTLRPASWVSDFKKAKKIAYEIQGKIHVKVGEALSCSIGISWTKFLAKFASDIAPKKNILVISDKSELDKIFKGRPLADAWGINCRMEVRLEMLGINNLLDLKNYNQFELKNILGWYGYYLWANVNGLEISGVNKGTVKSKTIGHSYCLLKKTIDKKYLSSVLYKLCEKTGRRLRESNQEAQGLGIFLAYTRGGGIGKSFKTGDKMFTTEEIFKGADDFLEKANLILPIRMLAVNVFRLTPVTSQMSLFNDNLSLKELSRAMDKINNKWGEYAVVSGRMFKMGDVARDRIGFRKTLTI